MRQGTADLCIIGAGSAGLSLAAGAAQMGARVVLIEGAEMGGDCLNTGCVPSKALLAAARAAQALRAPGIAGIAPVEPTVDFAAVMGHVREVIATIAPFDGQPRFEALGVQVIRARAAFTAPDVVQAGDWRIRARRFAIATGSHAAMPEIPGLHEAGFLTNETIFALQDLPQHLVILGGGPIGIELAFAFRRLGAEVTVIEALRALGREDPEAAAVVLDQLRAEGVRILEGRAVTEVLPGPVLRLADGTQVAGSHLLVATGRKPALEGLGLEVAGVAYDPQGITVDARLRTSNRRIFALGDVAGQGQFTHLAAFHAGIVLRQAVLGLPVRASQTAVPRVTYSDPELAQIGLTEAEAQARHGATLKVLHAPFHHNDRALAEASALGFVKVMAVRGRAVGVTVVGRGAGDLIGLWAMVLARNLPLSAVASMIAPYPTRGEASKRAAGAYFSPKLFDSPGVKRLVRLVQRWLP
jgi:pyruvate/2-oxoglutarate dehydrogenase complex dihydrolipoamide dehydrogenase (E3) component